MPKAKPFIKWVGGKGQLLEQLDALLPPNLDKKENLTYIEPFVGGGAMLFYMLQEYQNITRVIINDINPDLIKCYLVVRDYVYDLIKSLKNIENRYRTIETEEDRKLFYLSIRSRYNEKPEDLIENTTLFFS